MRYWYFLTEIPAYFLFGCASPKGKLKQLSRDARLALGEPKKATPPYFLTLLISTDFTMWITRYLYILPFHTQAIKQ